MVYQIPIVILFAFAFQKDFISVVNPTYRYRQTLGVGLCYHAVFPKPFHHGRVAYSVKAELLSVAGNFPQAHAVHIEIKTGSYHFPFLFGFPETIIYGKGTPAFLAEITPFFRGVVEPETPFDYVRAFALRTLSRLKITLILIIYGEVIPLLVKMGKIKFMVEGYQCGRCEHKWVPKIESEPRVCPKCKSPYWNVPRKIKR